MADLASRAVFTCSTSQFAAQSQACRRLGLAKWPYQHTGPRKRRRVSGAESDDDHKSLLERVLKDVFHEFLTEDGTSEALVKGLEDGNTNASRAVVLPTPMVLLPVLAASNGREMVPAPPRHATRLTPVLCRQ
mgnify:FL=1|jgi:hypothetical protein